MQEMIEKKGLEKAKVDLVEVTYYWEMYHSDICWKGKQSIIRKMLTGSVEIRDSKARSPEREYKNVCYWLGMEAICNYVVS